MQAFSTQSVEGAYDERNNAMAGYIQAVNFSMAGHVLSGLFLNGWTNQRVNFPMGTTDF